MADREDLIPVNFASYGFVFSLFNINFDFETKDVTFTIPPEFGRWVVKHKDGDGQESFGELVDCRQVIKPEVAITAEPDVFKAY